MSLPTNLRLEAETSSIPAGLKHASNDPRALRILAKTIYRELRQGGLAEEDVMSIAGELLSLVTCDVKDRRRNAENGAVSEYAPSSTPASRVTPTRPR